MANSSVLTGESDDDVFNSDISMVMLISQEDVCDELVGEEFEMEDDDNGRES